MLCRVTLSEASSNKIKGKLGKNHIKITLCSSLSKIQVVEPEIKKKLPKLKQHNTTLLY